MKIVDKLKDFFKKLFNKEQVLQLEAGKPKGLDDSLDIGNKSEKTEKDNFKEEMKLKEPKSYTEMLKGTLEEAKENRQVAMGLDFKKEIMGAVLEEKGASKELIELYRNSNVSESNKFIGNIDTFFIPEVDGVEPNAEGIKHLIEEYRRQVQIPPESKGNEYIIQSTYKEKDDSLVKLEEINVNQTIKINQGRVQYSLNKQTIRDRDEGGKQIVENKKYLERNGGKDVKLTETRSGNQFDKDNLYYEIKRKDEKAIVTVGRNNDIKSPYTISYEQKAPQSLLDDKKGLGFYDQNSNAKRYYQGDMKDNPDALKDNLMKQGISLEEKEPESQEI